MFAESPRILYVTTLFPYGYASGARLRIRYIGDILRRIGRVSLVVAPLGTIDEAALAETREKYTGVDVTPAGVTPVNGVLSRLRHEFDRTFLNTHRLAVDEPGRARMLSSRDQFDLVWVHTVRTANAYRISRWPCSVLDIDDVHSQLYRSMSQAASTVISRAVNLRMSWIWRARESRLASRFDSLVVCSDADRLLLGSPNLTYVVRNGFEAPASEPVFCERTLRRIGFIGTLNYQPNQEGIQWFARQVWPLIRERTPGVRLRVVGQGCGEELRNLASDIDWLGYVEDPAREMATWSASIVPIRSGGGTRVKIAEAFSRKCPVVSTSMGAFGYDVQNRAELLLADEPGEFAESCVRLINDPGLGGRLTNNAWCRFKSEWSLESVRKSVEAVVEGTLRRCCSPVVA